MLDRAVALALGQFEIGHGHVVLEIDEVLVAFVVLAAGRREPDRLDGTLAARFRRRLDEVRDRRATERPRRRLLAGSLAFGQRRRAIEGPVGGAHCPDAVVMAVGPKA